VERSSLNISISQDGNNAKAKSGTGKRGRGAQNGAAGATVDTPKTRQIHKAGGVSISAYLPAEVKASLRIVQAKTGDIVKECLAEALGDIFRKYNAPVSVALREGR